jgi:HAD superfamily hydrolase (TIGR01490 family)
MSTAAFFDIDGTLFREGLISEIFKKFVTYEIVEADRWYREVQPEFENWKRRQGDYDRYMMKMMEIFMDSVKGLHKTQMEFIARNIVKQKGERVYVYTRDRIKWHKAQGHKVISISGSPVEFISEFAKIYGFYDFAASKYKLNSDNYYTGEVVPMWDSESKKNAIEGFIEKYNIDLDKSYAYGDTSGDFNMLRMVKHPTTINPTRELIEQVKEIPEFAQRLQVVVERKDIIYKLRVDQT